MFHHRIASDADYPLIVVMICTITLNSVYLFRIYVLEVNFEQEIAATAVANLSTRL